MNLQLINKKQENSDTISFFFKPGSVLNWKPGQFLRYQIPDNTPDERGINRFYSIASAPFENRIQLTTKIAPAKGSTFKNDLQKLNPGEIIEGFGPSGSFTVEDVFISEGKKLCFIAGGIGITPFRSILLDLDQQRKPLNITLLYANRTYNALFKNEFDALAKKHPEFKIYYIISEEPVIETNLMPNVKILPGKIDEAILQSSIINLQSSIIYISGPEPMVLSFEEMLAKLGVPKENIKRDYFPGYTQF